MSLGTFPSRTLSHRTERPRPTAVVGDVVRAANARRDGVLPTDVAGVLETFPEPLDLVAALQLARESGGRVRLLHAFDELASLTGYEYSADLLRQCRGYAEKVLQDASEIARAAGVPADTTLADDVPGQRLGDAVAGAAKRFDADLIVVGTHGRRGIGRVLLGSGAEQVIRLAPVPVLTVRAEELPDAR